MRTAIFALIVSLGASLSVGITSVAAQSGVEYLDNRSTASLVISSYYNAINSQEYLRAWSYYRAGDAPDWSSFEAGYEGTSSVTLKLGTSIADPGAGSTYFYQPVAILAHKSDGARQVYAGCYTLLLVSPSAQQLPPYQPIGITKGHLLPVSTSLDDSVPASCSRD